MPSDLVVRFRSEGATLEFPADLVAIGSQARPSAEAYAKTGGDSLRLLLTGRDEDRKYPHQESDDGKQRCHARCEEQAGDAAGDTESGTVEILRRMGSVVRHA